MINWLSEFFLDHYAGQVLARVGVSVAAYLAGPKVQALLGGAGVSVSVDPTIFAAKLQSGAHIALTVFKSWRQKAQEAPSSK